MKSGFHGQGAVATIEMRWRCASGKFIADSAAQLSD